MFEELAKMFETTRKTIYTKLNTESIQGYIKETKQGKRKELTVLKKTEEYSWLNKCSNNITKQAVKDACEAYEIFQKAE